MVKNIQKIPLIERILRIKIIFLFFAIIGKYIGGRVFCRLSHVVLKLEYACYCKTPIAFAVDLCRKAQRLAEKLSECVCRCETRWAFHQQCAVSRRCACTMVPIYGTNYVYMIVRDHCYTSIQAEWLHIILPYRRGLVGPIS